MTDTDHQQDDGPGAHDAGVDSASTSDVRPEDAARQPNGIVTTHPDAPLDSSDTEVATRRSIEIGDESDPPTPRFIQDENAWKRSKWIPYWVRRVYKSVAKWSRGPPNPQQYRIKPFFAFVQEYPLFVIERFLPKLKYRLWLLFFYFSIWIIAFVLVKRAGNQSTEIAGWGQPKNIDCGVTYWGSGNSCGLDGNQCRPFDSSGFPFRCPANCESYHVLNPRAVGDTEVIYQSLVVGGPPNDVDPDEAVYRGDSFICGAAVHAGIASNENGGCGVVKLVGYQENFVSSQRHGITSIGFDSYFPLSFQFVPGIKCSASDKRWDLLAISAVFTGVLSPFTSSAALFFFPNFIGIFWTIGMALDPPPSSSVADLFSGLLGKFLPAMFCVWVMYDKMGIRHTLRGLTAQIEKTVLWLGPCWVGAMDNYTLSFIPIQRLSGHDLAQQPGAKAALAFIIIALVVILASQVWFFRQEGRLVKYAKLYGILIVAIIISLLLPGLNLRIHHYILALVLLPATALQTRPSLVYQGLLMGLFINGISRWGFDSVLQTPAALQGDAQKGTELPSITPTIQLGNTSDTTSNITFSWKAPKLDNLDGISVLVNDVERFRSYFEDKIDVQSKFVWSRNSSLDLPEYFRFAFMDGSTSGDYTKAGIWTADGEWEEMKSGPSRVKARSPDGDHILSR